MFFPLIMVVSSTQLFIPQWFLTWVMFGFFHVIIENLIKLQCLPFNYSEPPTCTHMHLFYQIWCTKHNTTQPPQCFLTYNHLPALIKFNHNTHIGIFQESLSSCCVNYMIPRSLQTTVTCVASLVWSHKKWWGKISREDKEMQLLLYSIYQFNLDNPILIIVNKGKQFLTCQTWTKQTLGI